MVGDSIGLQDSSRAKGVEVWIERVRGKKGEERGCWGWRD